MRQNEKSLFCKKKTKKERGEKDGGNQNTYYWRRVAMKINYNVQFSTMSATLHFRKCDRHYNRHRHGFYDWFLWVVEGGTSCISILQCMKFKDIEECVEKDTWDSYSYSKNF
jgi:hypothetical protein